jgi:hypothetical protein
MDSVLSAATRLSNHDDDSIEIPASNRAPRTKLVFDFPRFILVTFCAEWLTMNDLAHLDSAMCDYRRRSYFLSQIGAIYAIFNGQVLKSTSREEGVVIDSDLKGTASKRLNQLVRCFGLAEREQKSPHFTC